MGLQIVTAAAGLAVSIERAREHLRLNDDESSDLVQVYLQAAQSHAERFLGRALIDSTWDYFLDAFPSGAITIPLSPVIEVESVNYTDTAGNEQSFAGFIVDRSGDATRVSLAANGSWPTPIVQNAAVRIRFRAGYLDQGASPQVENVPVDIKAAILMILGSLYANRETVVVGVAANQLPWGAEQLLRLRRFDLSMA